MADDKHDVLETTYAHQSDNHVAPIKAAGGHYSHPITYISGTGIAGTDNTAQTHANIIENEGGGLGTVSAPNVAGFDWDADQDITFSQSQVGNNHCVLYALIVDILPKGA